MYLLVRRYNLSSWLNHRKVIDKTRDDLIKSWNETVTSGQHDFLQICWVLFFFIPVDLLVNENRNVHVNITSRWHHITEELAKKKKKKSEVFELWKFTSKVLICVVVLVSPGLICSVRDRTCGIRAVCRQASQDPRWRGYTTGAITVSLSQASDQTCLQVDLARPRDQEPREGATITQRPLGLAWPYMAPVHHPHQKTTPTNLTYRNVRPKPTIPTRIHFLC